MQHVTPGTHMDYVYEMARTLKEERGLSLELLIEKPTKTHLPDWVLVQSYANPVLRSLENLWFMIRARMRGVKVFYIHYSFLSAITAGVVARLTGAHVFYWNAGMPWQYKRYWREEWYQRLAYKCIHTLVTGAEALRQPYATMYGLDSASIRVIPNWIDRASIHKDDSVRNETRARLGIPLEAPLLLFVHKLSKRKGAHFLPELMDVLKDETVHLVIAGDGPLADNLRTEFKARGMDTRVHLLGVVPREEVKALYQAADVFIMPSEEEGSPHSLIEAMAHGLPFVTFDVGGVTETATAELARFVVPFGDIQAMARRVAEISAGKYTDTQARFERVLPRYEKSVVVDAFLRLLTTGTTDDLV